MAGDNPLTRLHRTEPFACPGRAGDEGVGALDAEPPGLGVIPEPDGDAKQGNLPGWGGVDHLGQRVTSAELQPDASRSCGDDAGVGNAERQTHRFRSGRHIVRRQPDGETEQQPIQTGCGRGHPQEARNPLLAQPVTEGHAMRLNHESAAERDPVPSHPVHRERARAGTGEGQPAARRSREPRTASR